MDHGRLPKTKKVPGLRVWRSADRTSFLSLRAPIAYIHNRDPRISDCSIPAVIIDRAPFLYFPFRFFFFLLKG